MTINARDYYPQGPDAFGDASREHADRIARVRRVRDEIGAYLEALANAADF